MKLKILKSFAKDQKKINDKKLLNKVKKIIEEIEVSVKNIDNVDEIPFKIKNIRKITGAKYAYRIKVDTKYRIGAIIVEVDGNSDIKMFLLKRFLHRKDIYNKFPSNKLQLKFLMNNSYIFQPFSIRCNFAYMRRQLLSLSSVNKN